MPVHMSPGEMMEVTLNRWPHVIIIMSIVLKGIYLCKVNGLTKK